MKVLKAIPGMPYAGIDFMTKKPLSEKHDEWDYAIIEVNNMPGVKLHFFPQIGKSRNCAAAILDMLF